MTTLTDSELGTLRKEAAAGKSFRFACEQIRRGPKTVRAALEQMGLDEEIGDQFARSTNDRTDGTIRVLALGAMRQRPPRLPESPQAQWLARPWRLTC